MPLKSHQRSLFPEPDTDQPPTKTDFEFQLVLPAGVQLAADMLSARQELCRIKSPNANFISILALPVPQKKPIVAAPLFRCSSSIHVSNVQADTLISIFSDKRQGLIGHRRFSFEGEGDIGLTTSLVKDDIISAIQSGCVPSGIRSSDKIPVQELPAVLPMPGIKEPVHPFSQQVIVHDVIPGAQVHVFVDDVERSFDSASTNTLTLLIGRVEVKQRLTVLQRICSMVSEKKRPGVEVTLGVLHTSATIDPPVKGSDALVTVTATDTESGQSIAGKVRIGTALHDTGIPFHFTFEEGKDPPNSTVSAPDYADTPVVWTGLMDPAPIVSVTPSLIVRGVTNTIVVHAVDHVTHALIAGDVIIAGLGPNHTNSNIAMNFSSGNPPVGTVKTPGRPSVNITWPRIVDAPTAGGISKLSFFNCRQDKHTLFIWVRDLTAAGSAYGIVATMPTQTNASGACPFNDDGQPADATVILDLQGALGGLQVEHKHLYQIAIVDVDLPTCGGQNNPDIINCTIQDQPPIVLIDQDGPEVTLQIADSITIVANP